MQTCWTYTPNFLAQADAQKMLAELLNTTPWEQGSIVLFGKQRLEPRLKSWHSQTSKTYAYSGVQQIAKAYTPLMVAIQNQIMGFCANSSFNSVLVNLYRNQLDSMGWHADDEPELGPEPMIASLSLGASRPLLFRQRDRELGARSEKINLESGSLLVMHKNCQKLWQHSVPKLKAPCEPRINLTFRQLI